MDPNLRFHLLVDACPPINRTTLVLEEGAFEGLVNQGLSEFSQVSLSSPFCFLPLHFSNVSNTFVFQMFPFQLKMGAAIVGLPRENATINAQLEKVQALEHELERVVHCLSIEKSVHSLLEAEVSQKEQLALDLTEA